MKVGVLRRGLTAGLAFGLGLSVPLALGAQEAEAPLSAIDWLSESVNAEPVIAPGVAGEAPVADSARVPSITVTPLDLPSPDRIGLLPPSSTGLPRTLWSGSTVEDVVTLVRAERVETLPALQGFLMTLMLTEGDPPAGAGPSGHLFLARVDKLLDMGAVDPAFELLQAADPATPELFRRYFDVALLTGTEDRACRRMADRPSVAPTLSARVFCLARSGDWSAAALTLNTAVALGDVSDEDEALLARFLDPELFEGEADLPPPSRPSPLVYRMREGIGQGLSTTTLPRAFAHADLHDTRGWKIRLEAAERLARAGAIPHTVLFDLYRLQRPAASGGVWDRARAFQSLDDALAEGDDVSDALAEAWAAAKSARIEVPFAESYAQALDGARLSGPMAREAFQISLLSRDYEAVALERDPTQGGGFGLVADVAMGQVSERSLPDRPTPRDIAVRDAFTTAAPDPVLMAMAEDGRLGEALLRAVATFTEGAQGDVTAARDALAFFRAVGLEDLARRAALQLLILDRAP